MLVMSAFDPLASARGSVTRLLRLPPRGAILRANYSITYGGHLSIHNYLPLLRSDSQH